ncbi:MAG: tetratricopeptide repeat protein [Candidatus Cloacimonetes bacterium]|nr:tetratricopeptide repeat protein [Candidatus Cloacimonadota bacterium]
MIDTKDIQTLIQLSEFEEAIELCQNLLESHPDHQGVLFYLAQSFSYTKQYNQSIKTFEKLIELNPKSANHYSNIAVELLKNNQATQALSYLKKSLTIDPNSAISHFNLANTFQHLNDYPNTIKHYKQAIKLDKKYTKAHSNLGAFYLKHQQLQLSLQSLLQGINLDPNCVNTHLNLSNVYRELKAEDKSFDHAVLAYQLAQNDIEVLSNLNNITLSTCQWQNTTAIWQLMDQLNFSYMEQEIPMIEPPFLNIARNDDPSINLAIAQHTCNALALDQTRLRVIPLPKTGEPLKVGYISGDFNEHPVGQAIVNLFKKHSQNILSHAISYGKDDQSQIRKTIEQNSHCFIDISKDSNQRAIKKIHDLKLHILVDLSGHTKRNRMEILAARPSRIQAAYLGYPSTTGSSFHDYLIADDIVIPNEHKKYYSETVLNLPCYYHLVDHEHEISDKYKSKECLGLPKESFVFGSHCAKYKITPALFDAWVQILKQVENSVLWLAYATEYSKNNLMNTLTHQGINPDRVYFANYELNKADHLNRLQFADLLLDTSPYNGHTTTNDALLAQTPVLTIKGNHFASKVSQSILTRMNLSDLIASDLSDYVQKAVDLANNPKKTKQLKELMNLNKNQLNMDDLIVQLEKTYYEMIQLEKRKHRP